MTCSENRECKKFLRVFQYVAITNPKSVKGHRLFVLTAVGLLHFEALVFR